MPYVHDEPNVNTARLSELAALLSLATTPKMRQETMTTVVDVPPVVTDQSDMTLTVSLESPLGPSTSNTVLDVAKSVEPNNPSMYLPSLSLALHMHAPPQELTCIH